MSRSIHITSKNFKGLTKKEIDDQAADPNSDLKKWGEKSHIKKVVAKKRKANKEVKIKIKK